MEYTKPELVLVGEAAEVVLGIDQLGSDNGAVSFNHPQPGFATGLDE